RVGLVEELKPLYKVQWLDANDCSKGFDYLYLTKADYEKLPPGTVEAHKVSQGGEERYVLDAIIGEGQKSTQGGIGVENLQGSGLIAGETSRAYQETFTLSYITGRSVGIGAYLNRLGQRNIQMVSSPMILTGYAALNKLLGKNVYSSQDQLGGPQIMVPNGVTHQFSASKAGHSPMLKAEAHCSPQAPRDRAMVSVLATALSLAGWVSHVAAHAEFSGQTAPSLRGQATVVDAPSAPVFLDSAIFERLEHFKDVGVPATLQDQIGRATIADGTCRSVVAPGSGPFPLDGYAFWHHNPERVDVVLKALAQLPSTSQPSKFVIAAKKQLPSACFYGNQTNKLDLYRPEDLAKALYNWHRAICDRDWEDPAEQPQQQALTTGFICMASCDTAKMELPAAAVDAFSASMAAAQAVTKSMCAAMPWTSKGPVTPLDGLKSYEVVRDDQEGMGAILDWLSYVPKGVIDHEGSRKRGFFDAGSWIEYLEGWGRTVIVGRARLGGMPMGVIAVETRSVDRLVPADPSNSESCEVKETNGGKVWFPDSAFKTAQALKDFNRGENLPVIIFANWRGFSGGTRDMYNEILKFGAMIVDALVEYDQPIFIYIPKHGELRGGAWVVIDPAINPDKMEMYADVDARGGILEPPGIVEVKYRAPQQVEAMHRIDAKLKDLDGKLAGKEGAAKTDIEK
ncbi:HFA1, partial [Symbiodinium sp. KB8]